jgi:hypothetical protein
VVLRILPSSLRLRLRGSHPLWPAFPNRSARPQNNSGSPTTPASFETGLGSSAFARHYSRNPFLFLRLLRCFSSPGSLPFRDDGGSHRRVSPFGHHRLLRLHTTRLRFSQCTTSFIGTGRQGILRAPLVPAPHSFEEEDTLRRFSSRVIGAASPPPGRAMTLGPSRSAPCAFSCSIWFVNLPLASRQRSEQASQLPLSASATTRLRPLTERPASLHPTCFTCSPHPPTKQPRQVTRAAIYDSKKRASTTRNLNYSIGRTHCSAPSGFVSR